FESKKQKAIETLGEHMGELPSFGGPGMSSGAIEDKTDKGIDDDLGGYDGDIEDAEIVEETKKAAPASEEEKKAAEVSFDDEIDDEDLDAILGDL
ncbi:MAG: hypothetical protein KI788_03990, partial [Mameliella sp.]|nr:hypothetical protein [Mameliella sp.]